MADGICNNCGTTLAGPYCHACGQKEVDDEWQSLGTVLRHLWGEIVSFDFKSARTLAGLLRPGHLSAEFIAGRRARYLEPVKLYLLCAALFFILGPMVGGFSLERHLAREPDGSLRALTDARMAATGMPRATFAEHFDSNAKTVYTLSPILNVLVLTLLLRAFYRRRFDRLGPHAIVAVHYIAFFYLLALAAGAVSEAFHLGNWLLLALTQGGLAVYLFVALRRVYHEPAGPTLAKTAALIVLVFAADSPINVGARLLTVALT